VILVAVRVGRGDQCVFGVARDLGSAERTRNLFCHENVISQ
jgi:hypothetical protein